MASDPLLDELVGMAGRIYRDEVGSAALVAEFSDVLAKARREGMEQAAVIADGFSQPSETDWQRGYSTCSKLLARYIRRAADPQPETPHERL